MAQLLRALDTLQKTEAHFPAPTQLVHPAPENIRPLLVSVGSYMQVYLSMYRHAYTLK